MTPTLTDRQGRTVIVIALEGPGGGNPLLGFESSLADVDALIGEYCHHEPTEVALYRPRSLGGGRFYVELDLGSPEELAGSHHLTDLNVDPYLVLLLGALDWWQTCIDEAATRA